MRISGNDVIRAVSEYYKLSLKDLHSEARYRSVSRPRQVAFYLMKELCYHLSYPAIGRMLGNRDHTTVLHGKRKIEELLPIDPCLSADVDALRAILTAKTEVGIPVDGWGVYAACEDVRRAA